MLEAADMKLTPKSRHTQDWVELTRPDFTENVAVEFHKEPMLENFLSEQAENPTTLHCSRLDGMNRHLNEQSQRVEQQMSKDRSVDQSFKTGGRCRRLSGDITMGVNQEAAKPSLETHKGNTDKEHKGRERSKTLGKTHLPSSSIAYPGSGCGAAA